MMVNEIWHKICTFIGYGWNNATCLSEQSRALADDFKTGEMIIKYELVMIAVALLLWVFMKAHEKNSKLQWRREEAEIQE